MKGLQKFIQKKLQSDSFILLGIVVFWRIVITIAGIAGLGAFHSLKLPVVSLSYGPLWDMWARWDGWYYIDISLRGYFSSQVTAFFPLYPLLIKIISKLFFINPVLAGLLIAHFALWGALYFIFKMAENLFSREIAFLSVLLLLFFPFSLFFGLVYTESLFLFLASGALFFAQQKKWILVFFFGFFAALTRNLGVLLFIPLGFEYLQYYGFRFKKYILALSGPIMGLCTYMIYLYRNFGTPLQFVLAQSNWKRAIVLNPWIILKGRVSDFISDFQNIKVVEMETTIIAILFLVFILFSLQKKYRFPKSFIAYMVVMLLPGILQNTWGSVNRYVIVIFPVFILLAIMLKERTLLRSLILAGFALLLGVSTVLFVNFLWTG